MDIQSCGYCMACFMDDLSHQQSDKKDRQMMKWGCNPRNLTRTMAK